jgi:putative aldouronate transport system substrate-binding protein
MGIKRFIAILLSAALLLLTASCAPKGGANETTASAAPAQTTAAQAAEAAGAEEDTAATTAAAEPETTKETQKAAETTAAKAEAEPVKEEPVPISVWTPMGRFNHEDRADTIPYENDFGFVEDKFNIRLNYTYVPNDQAKDQMGIMLATNSLTDIINIPGAYDTFLVRPDQLFADEQIINLKTVAAVIPEYMRIVNENPIIMKNVMADAGNIMYFCMPLSEQELGMSGGLMIRKDWLDALNMQIPQSLDEFLDALRAFRANDMNGNGDNDEVPFCGTQGSLQVIGNLTGIQETFSMVGGSSGTVVFGPFETDAYQTRLKLIAVMAQEKLINDNYYNFDMSMRDTWIAEDRIGAALTGLGNLDKWNAMMKDHPTFLMWPFDNPKQPDGNRYFDRTDMSKSMRHDVNVISTAAKRPEKCAELINYMYTDEGHMLSVFGVEGITYTMEGNFPKYTDLIVNNPDGLSTGDAQGKYIGIYGIAKYEDMRVWAQLSLTSPGAREANIHTWTDTFTEHTNTPMPPAMMEPGDAEEYADIMADLQTYVLESVAKFTTGEWDIDADYGVFQDTCKRLGGERALELQTKAVKAWQARGDAPYKFTMERAVIDYWDKIPLVTNKGADLMDPALK